MVDFKGWEGCTCFARGFKMIRSQSRLRAAQVTTRPMKRPEDSQRWAHHGGSTGRSPYLAIVAWTLTCVPRPFLVATMVPKPQQPERRDVAFSSLNVAIDALNVMKDLMEGTPAKAAFASVSVVLTMIRVSALLVRPDKPRVNIYRILCSIKLTLWSLDWPAPMCFKPFTGG